MQEAYAVARQYNLIPPTAIQAELVFNGRTSFIKFFDILLYNHQFLQVPLHVS